MTAAAGDSLRLAVLAGRFLGAAPAVSELASFVASAEPAQQLLRWFGHDQLAAICSHPCAKQRLRAALDRDIAAIDAMLTAQLDTVLRHPRLRRLEGSWRGLRWLADRLPATGPRVRLKMLTARWAELCRDIERAVEFDQSHLFRKIHDEEFGIAGGEPYGLIAADYEIRHRSALHHPTDDVGALSGFAGIAAAAFAPMIFGVSPGFLGLDSFSDASPGFDPAALIHEGPDYQRWRNAAAQEDMRFLALALPHVLGRAPWADDGTRVDRFRFRSHTARAADRVWTSPVYGFAATAVRAFERYQWPAEVRGADISEEARGGIVDHLPFERFGSDPPNEPPPRAPLDWAFTDAQEDRLGEASLVTLTALEHLPEACFGALPTLHRPPQVSTAVARANQRLSVQLNTLLCVSRFAHCVKLMGRDMVGSYSEIDEVQSRLQRWLDGYVSGLGSGGAEVTAKYPLLEARVDVRERPGRPGVYNCTVHLKPYHQLDEIGASFRLVTEFAPRAAAA
jgi:type VI secretion system protein ImpD/type VI secretion system protein ImpC